MLLTGAEILVKALIDEGVDVIFGYPGGSVLNIYDSLYIYKEKINHILTCHEQNAAHAADGYARATGNVGVCLATSGPGATNLVTGIATAYMDSIPLVAITGNVPKDLLGKDSFQEVDIQGITMPVTKHNYIVKDVTQLQKIIKEAFYIARTGRPGPVLIDIPKDITAAKAIYKNREEISIEIKEIEILEEDLNKVAEMINESKKPFIYAGGGVVSAGANLELKELVEKIDAPICTSLMGKSAINSEHYLCTGMIGMHGTKASNLGVTKSDLIVALGARFSDRVITNQENIKDAKIIHIDIDRAEINKNIKSDACIVGDLKEILIRLLPKLREVRHKEWNKTINDYKLLKERVEGDSLTPEFFFETLNKVNNGEIILATEVGQHQMWAAQYFKFREERSFISSGGLGTMGFGLGASIGASMAKPNKKIINIAGDGSFAMNCNEFATAVTHNMPIIVVVMNNSVLGMVRQWQNLFYDRRYSQTTLNRKTDIVKLAEAFGGKGFRVTEREQLESILVKAINTDGPVIIDYMIDSDKKVFPMVAPGAPINQIISEEDMEK
ncbi:biosynthetic-type acetolactate synthase large subunit [uncultured Clostridium sp.]|uniref:biosynthetic-type acetolactate synthase large subunit n=1 Tax=uncultured Clostridium sp. TaxID=59620 RepID=UPI00263624B0|nr:biosynthetic-type acetolactate synthase large subunit [uncultured Clostridium sp.]